MRIEGAKELLPMMKKNITLRELFIGGNDIKEEGANAVAFGILSNRSITTLDLSSIYLTWGIGCNDIGSESTKTIAEALKENCTLLTLGLGTPSS